ncbi:MAG: hypothetical protein SV375_11110 [Thermodesulfobacteriota bacterium]|nr:hypothetical protein [Thermodesulfobacteriota bacterium]
MYSNAQQKGEQRIRRYHGYYSKVYRGKRKKQNQDEWMLSILESDYSSKERWSNQEKGDVVGQLDLLTLLSYTMKKNLRMRLIQNTTLLIWDLSKITF